MKKTCKLCFGTDFVEIDIDVICKKCGAVAETNTTTVQSTVPQKYHVSLSAESKLGSGNILDASLKLTHLNKKFTSKILNSTDVYLEYFSQSCEDLHMPKGISRNAFYLFQKLRHKKLGLGRTAVFCIIHAYTVADILYDGDLIIKTILYRFQLKRKITISQSLYRIKPAAIEMNIIGNTLDSDLLTFKKNIDSDKYRKATRIIDSFSGDSHSQTKAVQEFLDAYDAPIPMINAKRMASKQ